MKQSISYSKSGVDYHTLDNAKKLALDSAKETSEFLKLSGFSEVSDTRGESAFVWRQQNCYMASVLECLGTKNLVADEMYKLTDKTYYDIIGNDTIAAAINDLCASGAKPLVLHAFWGLWKDEWLADQKRTQDFINGWKSACDISQVTWGGGETPSLTKVISQNAVVLAASAVGIISPKENLISEKKIQVDDRILLLKSNGINANGISLARAIAEKLENRYNEKLSDGKTFGEAILTKTNIYAKTIQELLQANINIHYASNITGHGLRKIMRAKAEFSYIIEKLFDPQEIFLFIQQHANIDDKEMYQTYNMGQDYAIFLSTDDVKKAHEIIKKNGFESLDAGYVEKGERQVLLKPKQITYKGETLDLR